MTNDPLFELGTLLRRAAPPEPVKGFRGVQIDDPRLADILAPEAPLLCLYEGTLHGEGRFGCHRSSVCSGRTSQTDGCSSGVLTDR